MTSSQKQHIYYAGTAVCVDYNHAVVEEILRSIVYPFPSLKTEEISSKVWVEIEEKPERSYQLILDHEPIYKTKHPTDFAEMLLSKICYQLAFHSQEGVLFHAAGLAFGQSGILVPGGIGYGKSTFTAWMVSKGCDYLSDEFVYFPWKSDEMQSFYRPLHLKKPTRSVLGDVIDYDATNGLIQVGNHSDLIHPIMLKPDNHYHQPPVSVILFPHYQPDGEFVWQELSPAQAGLELMQFLINARNLPAHGFSEIARLARKSKAYKFSYSSFNQIEDLLFKSLKQA